MKTKKILLTLAASAVAAATLGVSASAALLATTVTKNDGPKDNVWETNFSDESFADVDITAVDKVVVSGVAEAFVKGGMGANVIKEDGTTGWCQPDAFETAAAGEISWVWDNIGGFSDEIGEDGNSKSYFKFEVWWQNATDDGAPTVANFTKVEMFDAEDTLLWSKEDAELVPAPEPEPAESEPESQPEASEATPAESEATSEGGDAAGNPDTGIALAIAPVALAAAGIVVVSKKRK